MCVITVSGGWYRGAQAFAEGLARRLGYRCVNREVLIRRAAAAGASEEELRKALLDPPSLFDRFVTHKRYVYLTQLQAALADEVRAGNVVYYGYAGHLLLSGAGPVFRIRIIGAREARIKAIQEDLELSSEDAVAQMHRNDVQRKKWTHYLYGVDWEDPSSYDMVLNLGHIIQVPDAADMVASMIREHSCFEMTPERRRQLEDFALASRVRAELAAKASYANHFVREVTAQDGTIHIESTLDDSSEILDIERVVSAVPGVREVDLRY